MKKKLITAAVFIVLLTAVTALFILISGSTESAGMTGGVITFSDKGRDITAELKGEYLALEDDKAQLYVLPDGNIRLLDKQTGKEYTTAAAQEGKGVFSTDDAELSSALIINYLADGMTETKMYSSKDSVEKKQYRIYLDGDILGVEYIMGEKPDSEFLPKIFTVERFEDDILPKLSDSDAEYLCRRYKKYYAKSDDPEHIPDDEVLSEYPILNSGSYYILVSADAAAMRRKTSELLQEAGYTYSAMQLDYGKIGYAEAVNPVTFKVTVEYRLENGDLIAELPADQIQFYADNPLLSVQVMKYFTSSVGDEGTVLVPSGSGGIIEYGPNAGTGEFRQRVYGSDGTKLQTSIPYEMQQKEEGMIFPMYAMSGNDCSVLGIVEGADAVAEFQVVYRDSAAQAGYVFDILQSDYASIGNAEPMLYCGAGQLSENIVLRYCITKETDYSALALFYRGYLIEKGLLNENPSLNKAPSVQIETVGLIYGTDGLLGLMPVKRAEVLTDFEQSQEIYRFFSESGVKNITLCLSGWNKEGLLSQTPGTVNFASKLGGRKGFEAAVSDIGNARISLPLNFAFYYGDSLFDGYSPGEDSARYIDKSVASVYGYDVISGWVKSDGKKTELVSPAKYSEFTDSYLKKLGGDVAVDIGKVAGVLNSDYRDGTYIDRIKARDTVSEILSRMESAGWRLTAYTANQYALKYIDLIDGMSVNGNTDICFSKSVPFVPIVLHGYIEYNSDAANLGGNIQKTVLKSIEYGAGVHFVLNARLPENLYDTEFSYLYDTDFIKKRDEVLEGCLKVQTALDGLNNIPIAEHSSENGVSQTVYRDGTVIVVNYNERDVELNGKTVPAESYLRISNN